MKRNALRAAFPHTIPVLTGYLVLGISYGVLMTSSGFAVWIPTLTSLTIFAGSMEFVLINLLLGSFQPLQAFVLTLMVNARHLFYGISMLDAFRNTGWKKFYLIFGLTDESFSVECTAEPPEGVDRKWFMFFVTLLDHGYWILGATLGGIFGKLLQFNTQGLDFAMTAMFVVIFMEQWKKDSAHISGMIGLALPALCLFLFGVEHFMLPSMAAILLALAVVRAPLERKLEGGVVE